MATSVSLNPVVGSTPELSFKVTENDYLLSNQQIATATSAANSKSIKSNNRVLVIAHDSPVNADIFVGPMVAIAEFWTSSLRLSMECVSEVRRRLF